MPGWKSALKIAIVAVIAIAVAKQIPFTAKFL